MNKILLDWNPQDELIYGSEQFGRDPKYPLVSINMEI